MLSKKHLAQPVANEPAQSAVLPDKGTLIAFAAFVIVSGGASVAIRFTYAEIAPFWGAAMRFVLGALFFWIIALVKKIELPKDRALIGAVLYGALAMGISFTLIYWGLVKTPASLYQILMATVPLLTLFLATLHGLERFRTRGLLGALLSVVGIAVVVGGSGGSELSPLHLVAILIAAASIAEAGIVVKKFPRNNPIMMNAVGMSVGAVMLFIASLASGETWTLPAQAATWLAFGYIVVFVTVIAFFLYVFVLGRWTASGTSYGFVLIPLITVVLAATLAGEQITASFIAGSILVLLGVWFGALLPYKQKTGR